MNSDNILTTYKDWTLRVRPGTGKKILLLLHGWTGDENSMSIFMRNFPADYWVLSPRAPFAAGTGGYTWRAPAQGGTWPTIDLFRPAIDRLVALLAGWAAENNLNAASIDVAGFSQGGALTFALGVLHPDLVGKMGILAGFAPEGSEEILSPNLLKGKNIFVSHGTRDERVPISMAARTIQLLENAGARVQFCQSDIGHKLSADCLKALEQYLKS